MRHRRYARKGTYIVADSYDRFVRGGGWGSSTDIEHGLLSVCCASAPQLRKNSPRFRTRISIYSRRTARPEAQASRSLHFSQSPILHREATVSSGRVDSPRIINRALRSRDRRVGKSRRARSETSRPRAIVCWSHVRPETRLIQISAATILPTGERGREGYTNSNLPCR